MLMVQVLWVVFLFLLLLLFLMIGPFILNFYFQAGISCGGACKYVSACVHTH